jgi:hypothetical protein
MQDDHFEWDDAKAVRNWRNHGVTFEMAREAFKDMFAVEWVDRGHGDAEERLAMLAMVEHRLMFVSYDEAAQNSYYLGKTCRTFRKTQVS